MKPIQIGNKTIGKRTFIIAEFGVNHLNSLERAKEGIIKAAQAGADAIKFQTYTADELVVKGTPKFWNWEGDAGKDQHEAYQILGNFPKEWYPELLKCCEENNIEFLSTPFSFEAADFLNSLGMKAFKIASSDLSTLPFLEHIAKFGKPILLSTGAATMEEIRQAVKTIKKWNKQIIILHCTLCYPTADEDANFRIIQTLRKFPYPTGISDHTIGAFSSAIAVAMGAVVVEKHFTTDKTLPDSADHWLSVNPEELADLVQKVRKVETLMGSAQKRIFPCEKLTRKYDKRSIVSKVAILKGSVISEEMLTYKRPGTGIPPSSKIVGMIAKKDIPADTTLKWTHLRKSKTLKMSEPSLKNTEQDFSFVTVRSSDTTETAASSPTMTT